MEIPYKGRKLLFLKTDLPALMAFVLFAVLIFFYMIPGFEKAMMDRKRTLIKEMTSSAYSILEHYHSKVQNGIIEADTAKQQAKNTIASIRYGAESKDYFWITDRHPYMIIHPYKTELNGQDLSDYRDSRGVLIFVEFSRAVSETGDSYVEYMWQWNDDSTKVVPKLSYVRLFEPWDWIIGTGIYIEDVRTEIRRMEFRFLLISGAIGLIIILLLSIITRQSHRTEQKRRQTEEELYRSREMYRTLAEVVTEGVIIWTGSGIQANKTLLSLLEYREEEFIKKNITDIVSSCDVDLTSGVDRIYGELETRKFGECILITAQGNQINVYSDYSRILIGDKKAIVIVVRPVKKLSPGSGLMLPNQILSSVSTGFFRISVGRKIRFLDATDATLRILGFNDIEELKKTNIESLFNDTGQLKLIRRILGLKNSVDGFPVSLKTVSGNKIEVLVNIVVTEHIYPDTWCDGSIEFLTISEPSDSIIEILPAGYYFSLIRDTSVVNIMTPPPECRYDTPASEALKIMAEKKSGFIIVNNDKNIPGGIADLQSFANGMAAGLSVSTETGKFINAIPEFIGTDRTLAFAADKLAANDKPLLVTNDRENVKGVITTKEILIQASLSGDYIKAEIGRAASISDISDISANMKHMAVSLILGNCNPVSVSFFISHTADQICRRIIDLCLEKTGEPPCRFAFLLTGSAGRMEQTLSTDQDNCIVFEDCTGIMLERSQRYFHLLGREINEALALSGFNLCKGNVMAGNPKWCQPLSTWKEYFSRWIRVPDPSNLLDMSIFFDFRHCYGDEKLTHELREFVNSNMTKSDIYFHHMVSAWSAFQPPQIKEIAGNMDIKRLLMPLTGIVRLYSLKYGLGKYSTHSRILDLYRENHFSQAILRSTLFALRELSSVRLGHQADCINNGAEPDNRIDLSLASEHTLFVISRSADYIRDLMLKAATDFHHTEI